MKARFVGFFTRAFLLANWRFFVVHVLPDELLLEPDDADEPPPGLLLGVALRFALPLALVRLARRPQVGHAPRPTSARTRRAMAICSALVARCAWEAYLRPPYARHELPRNCSPP